MSLFSAAHRQIKKKAGKIRARFERQRCKSCGRIHYEGNWWRLRYRMWERGVNAMEFERRNFWLYKVPCHRQVIPRYRKQIFPELRVDHDPLPLRARFDRGFRSHRRKIHLTSPILKSS